MSYEKVRSIQITGDKVFINCASNNVIPLYYVKEEFPYFSKILNSQGKTAVEIELLKSYESGSLQQGNNKYTKALEVLNYVLAEEYNKFNWRTQNAKYGTPEHQAERDLRESQEFKDLLLKALNYKLPKEPYFITKKSLSGNIIYAKVTSRHIIWKHDKSKATKFLFKAQAQNQLRSFRATSETEITQ